MTSLQQKEREKTKGFTKVLIEKALGLCFMVELNMKEVGFIIEIGLEIILDLLVF